MPWITNQGYMRIGKDQYHRRIYQDYYKCCLLPFTVLHHNNHNPLDNRIRNLKPMYRAQHNSIHKKIVKSKRKCRNCQSTKTYVYKNKREQWNTNPITGEKFICNSCNNDIKDVMRLKKNYSRFFSFCNSNFKQTKLSCKLDL